MIEVRERILNLARAELGDATPAPDADLTTSLDSVQRLVLVVAVEDAFEIALDPYDDAAVRTLDDVVALVTARLSRG